MGPRRSYRKSTTGCKTCKRRRVKCDEIHPRCGQCTNHAVQCDFESANNGSMSSMTLPQNTEHGFLLTTPETIPQEPVLQLPLAVPLRNAQQLMEMRLLHHCTLMTCETMRAVQDPQLRHIWSTVVPSMAFQSGSSNYLLDLLLAASATHLRILDPNDHTMQVASSYYFDCGLRKFNVVLHEINEENSPLILVSSVLVALHVLISRSELTPCNQYSVPSAWFRTLQGIQRIVSFCRPWIRKSNMAPVLLKDQPLSPVPEHLGDGEDPFLGLLVGLEDESLESNRVNIYVDSVRYLSQVYAGLKAREEKHLLRSSLLAFPANIPPQYIDLLECHDPRVLVITAHFFGLISFVDEIWWLQGVARKEIMGILTLIPDNWLWAMKWPIAQLYQ